MMRASYGVLTLRTSLCATPPPRPYSSVTSLPNKPEKHENGLPESVRSVMILPDKAAGTGARAGARRTSSPTRNAVRADQGLLNDPG